MARRKTDDSTPDLPDMESAPELPETPADQGDLLERLKAQEAQLAALQRQAMQAEQLEARLARLAQEQEARLAAQLQEQERRAEERLAEERKAMQTEREAWAAKAARMASEVSAETRPAPFLSSRPEHRIPGFGQKGQRRIQWNPSAVPSLTASLQASSKSTGRAYVKQGFPLRLPWGNASSRGTFLRPGEVAVVDAAAFAHYRRSNKSFKAYCDAGAILDLGEV